MSEILLVERMVLESLEKKSLSIKEIEEDTGLESHFLSNILSLLLMRGMLIYDKQKYSLNIESKPLWIKELKKKGSVKAELKELFTSLINGLYSDNMSDDNQLKIKKIWLTKDEKRILDIKLGEIDSFIKQIKQCRRLKPVREATKEKEVLFWGHSSYQSLVDGFLSTV